jgi:hypothetical protein
LAGLLTGLLLSTTALLATLSRLLVLLRAALSTLILISHIYCYSCGDYSHQGNTDRESKFPGASLSISNLEERSIAAVVVQPTFGQISPWKKGRTTCCQC